MARASKSGVSSPESPFGKPMVLDHGKKDGGIGVKMDSMVSKPIESDYVEPMQRTNPGYLEKLKFEAWQAEEAKRQKAKESFGAGFKTKVFGASPNSPHANVQTIF